MIYSFHKSARAEFAAAITYFNHEKPGLGIDFQVEVEKTIDGILEAPERWQESLSNTRSCRVHRFPYRVIYRIKTLEIEILAIASQHRRPNYWKRRTIK